MRDTDELPFYLGNNAKCSHGISIDRFA